MHCLTSRSWAWAGLAWLAASLLATGPALAQGGLGKPVADSALAGVRGGFTAAHGGLVVSFGVQRAVYVDGQLMAAAGPANLAATVVQNSLNNRQIQTVTTIDVVANSWQLYQGAGLQSSIGLAVAASLRR